MSRTRENKFYIRSIGKVLSVDNVKLYYVVITVFEYMQ